MSDFMPTDGMTNGNGETPATGAIDVLELRLPLKAGYLPLVRATAGVLAGGMSFNYDQVIQVRTAVAEAFDLTIRRTARRAPFSAPVELTVRFTITPDRLEVSLPTQLDDTGRPASQEEVESKALLESLVDEVELDGEANGAPFIRLVKYRQTDET